MICCLILLADFQLCKEKPRYIVNSLEEFLAPGALEKLNDKIAAEKERCSALAAWLGGA